MDFPLGFVAEGVSSLAGFEPRVQFVDHEGSAASTHDLGAGHFLQSFEGVANFHDPSNLIDSSYQLE